MLAILHEINCFTACILDLQAKSQNDGICLPGILPGGTFAVTAAQPQAKADTC